MQKRNPRDHVPSSLRFATLGLLASLAWSMPAATAMGDEVFATEASKFLELQRENYNSMLTGQNRLKRACSVPRRHEAPRFCATSPTSHL